eukprot:97120-Pelagomonas_calceolata.AAC.2
MLLPKDHTFIDALEGRYERPRGGFCVGDEACLKPPVHPQENYIQPLQPLSSPACCLWHHMTSLFTMTLGTPRSRGGGMHDKDSVTCRHGCESWRFTLRLIRHASRHWHLWNLSVTDSLPGYRGTFERCPLRDTYAWSMHKKPEIGPQITPSAKFQGLLRFLARL